MNTLQARFNADVRQQCWVFLTNFGYRSVLMFLNQPTAINIGFAFRLKGSLMGKSLLPIAIHTAVSQTPFFFSSFSFSQLCNIENVFRVVGCLALLQLVGIVPVTFSNCVKMVIFVLLVTSQLYRAIIQCLQTSMWTYFTSLCLRQTLYSRALLLVEYCGISP